MSEARPLSHDLIAAGDLMQSSLSRVVAFLDRAPVGLPYEVDMAIREGKSAVTSWTEARSAPVQPAGPDTGMREAEERFVADPDFRERLRAAAAGTVAGPDTVERVARALNELAAEFRAGGAPLGDAQSWAERIVAAVGPVGRTEDSLIRYADALRAVAHHLGDTTTEAEENEDDWAAEAREVLASVQRVGRLCEVTDEEMAEALFKAEWPGCVWPDDATERDAEGFRVQGARVRAALGAAERKAP